MHEVKTIKQLMIEAKDAEASENIETAESLYQQALQQDPLNEYAYGRLMIIYRRQKEKKKELDIINTALISYEKFYKQRQHSTKTITTISNKLNKAFGLADKKGNALYIPEPIATWQKRKVLLQKRMKKK